MRITTLAIATFVLFVVSLPLYAGSERHVNLPTREGVNVPSWVISPGEVRASVILFAGGGGQLKMTKEGIHKTKGNFLIRSRYRFSNMHLAVFIPDVPSDHGDMFDIRTQQDHATDIAFMIDWLRKAYPQKPVWLIGTSRGTLSAANAAARLPLNKNADGIILSASVTQNSNSGSDSLYNIALDKIEIPTLLVHHEQDACYVTPYSDIPQLLKDLSRVKIKAIKSYRGGISKGNECRAKSYHGFNGIEDSVVNDMVQWLLQNS